MRVLLISVNRERQPYPVAPLGLCYVAAALRAAHHEPRLLDLCFSDDIRADIEAAVRDFAPQAVGLGLRNLDNTSMVAPWALWARGSWPCRRSAAGLRPADPSRT